MLVSTVAVVLVGFLSILANMFLRVGRIGGDRDNKAGGILLIVSIVGIILAPIAGQMIQLAISRKREYLADVSGALLTRYPEGLASALEKIGQYGSPLKKQNTSTAHLFFANPLSKGSIAGLFSTHPPVEERVRRLRDMGHKV